ncbi:hypothetical protein EJB05_51666, partial [Eragrostis curvula]
RGPENAKPRLPSPAPPLPSPLSLSSDSQFCSSSHLLPMPPPPPLQDEVTTLGQGVSNEDMKGDLRILRSGKKMAR